MGKKGWSSLAGSNVSSPTDGYGSGTGNGIGINGSDGLQSYQSAGGGHQTNSFGGWDDDNYNSTKS